MANEKITAMYEDLPQILKIVLQFFFGWLIGGIYRIIRWTETKNTVTLLAGIVALIPGLDVVAWVVDLITEIAHNKIDILAD